jgi:uncharacterized Zn finger protein (UPF0148 family)
MPKTAVETAVCDICGAEVRGGSLFCYNCGGSVSKADEPEVRAVPSEPIHSVEVESENGIKTEIEATPVEVGREKAGRRKVRAANRQPAEIVWEPRQGVSWGFMIATAIFVIFAVALVIAAFYLR